MNMHDPYDAFFMGALFGIALVGVIQLVLFSLWNRKSS